MDVQRFVQRWRASTLGELQGYQSHFEDLCALTGHPAPVEADPRGRRFVYQKGVIQVSGRQGWADVWYEGHFAIEYKGKGGDLDAAYQQLLQYRDNLDNPPLLIVTDFDRIIIRTNYTGRTTRRITLLLDDFLTGRPVDDTGLPALEIIRRCFYDPESLVPERTTAKLTEDVAKLFEGVAVSLRRDWGHNDMTVARYLSKLVFCMFASDVGLLPKGIVTRIIDNNRATSAAFASALSQLFVVMNSGGQFGEHHIPHFNGGIFVDPVALAIDYDNLMALREADEADWADVEPSIFGTLFERIIDVRKRAQLGKHYTSREDIETLIEPVMMRPLRREWEQVAARVDGLMAKGATAEAATEASQLLDAFVSRLASVRILDPACGSGNFLYVALEKLKLMEREAMVRAATWGLDGPAPRVHPGQLFGIETNEYAHELAGIVVWIGYLQWKRRNGMSLVDEVPILQPLDNIKLMDAILERGADDHPIEPPWPNVDFIIGNAPFIGGKRLRTELGDEYVNALFGLWDGRVRREADLCCYWHEKAREMVAQGTVKRVGLLATQSIRQGANRRTLERIQQTGSIFFAKSDRPWVLDGAAVRVSMVGFDDGTETEKVLDGVPVEGINANLTSQLDVTKALRLTENLDLCFQGPVKVGKFELTPGVAAEMLRRPNPNGRRNREVVRPWANGDDVTDRARHLWIIDFGTLSLEEAAQFEAPFEYVKRVVKPARDRNRRNRRREFWWQHGETVPKLRRELARFPRFLATPRVSKYRLFVWLGSDVLPDSRLYAFARDDDYFFGVLQSHVHEVWALATSSRHGVGNDPTYNNTTCFETFPLPWPPGHEDPADPAYGATAAAARELDSLREGSLNPEGLEPEALKKLTLTNLYNERPTWLTNAHKRLDDAVLAAYGWPLDISDGEILARLMALNAHRSGGDGT